MIENWCNTKCYHEPILRHRIRFCGIGPYIGTNIVSNTRTRPLWPKSVIVPQNESAKIVGVDIVEAVDDIDKIEETQRFIERTFDRLKNANIDDLFDKHCPRDRGCQPKQVPYVLDSYVTYPQVLAFVHGVLNCAISKTATKKQLPAGVKQYVFGTNRNYDIFKRNIRWLIIGNKRLNQVRGNFVHCGTEHADTSAIPWLSGLETSIQREIYLNFLYALVTYTLELLRRYFYITLSNPYQDKLFYYRYDVWQSVRSHEIKHMIHKELLVQVPEDANISNRRQYKLKLYLKEGSMRPICTAINPKAHHRHYEYSRFLFSTYKSVLYQMPNFKEFSLHHLLAGLRHMRANFIDQDKPIYFVCADVVDCFQSIDQNKMKSIIEERLYAASETGDMVFRKVEACIKGKLQTDWRLEPGPYYGYLRRKNNEVNDTPETRTMSVRDFIANYLEPTIINPIVKTTTTAKQAFCMTNGLLQGSQFSSTLCSIYVQSAFNKYLGELLQSDDCRLFCYVDDIFFLTGDLDKANKFIVRILSGFPEYNLHINLDKLAHNFNVAQIAKFTRNDPEHVVFYKQRISTKSLQCRYDFSFKGMGIEHTFKLDPYIRERDFVQSLTSTRFSIINLDCKLNGDSVVIENIFERSMLWAHRAAALILCSTSLSDLRNQRPRMLVAMIDTLARKVRRTISYYGRKKLIENSLAKRDIQYIVASTFYITWNRHKVRHRAIERDRLFQLRRRLLMRVELSLTNESYLVKEVVSKLTSDFPKSNLAKELKLPCKRWV